MGHRQLASISTLRYYGRRQLHSRCPWIPLTTHDYADPILEQWTRDAQNSTTRGQYALASAIDWSGIAMRPLGFPEVDEQQS